VKVLTHALRVGVIGIVAALFGSTSLGAQPSDFDGDGRADAAVYRPSRGTWYILKSAAAGVSVQWGAAKDVPVPGDYDGDGQTDVAVFRPSTGVWYIVQSTTGSGVSISWGTKGDLPAPADYDGDGRSDPAVFRPSTGAWHQLRSTTARGHSVMWGTAGDLPVPADYDGDGLADPTVYRRVGRMPGAQGFWYQLRSGTGSSHTLQWGASDDVPVAADYDGDRRADPAVFRPSNGVWYQMRSITDSPHVVQWGTAGDIPAVGDYDGDGRADPSVFRPSTGTWFQQRTARGNSFTLRWGRDGDLPVSNPRKPSVTSIRLPRRPAVSAPARPAPRPSAPPRATPPPPPAPVPIAGSGSGKLRVMTWNVHFGKTSRNVLNLDTQARVMANSGADVILLQEASTWDGDQPNSFPAKLRALTGQTWSKVWSSHNGSGTGEGTLILTRLPVVSSSIANYYNRGFSRVAVGVNGVTIDIFNGHLDYYDRTKRTNQLRSWMAWMDKSSGPEIAGGDFNSWWGETWIKTMETKYTDTWQDVTGSDQNGYTHNNIRFDFLFRARDSASRLSPRAAWVVSSSASDHRPLVADYVVR
jgi:endonuclease/exonuclease/phosphatase family metal-dependent hydrolase